MNTQDIEEEKMQKKRKKRTKKILTQLKEQVFITLTQLSDSYAIILSIVSLSLVINSADSVVYMATNMERNNFRKAIH